MVCASRIHRIPAIFARSSVHLVGGLPTLRLPLRGHHSRTFLPQRPSVLRAIYLAHCHLSLAILSLGYVGNLGFPADIFISDTITQGNSKDGRFRYPLDDFKPFVEDHCERPRLEILIFF
ncbi:hypothetical protein PYW08_010140 [Mythimna loreyi]|uniref:Uncharacterized protein n=1 Tax=Mythimna loreyi TaxID=667449 RepID=A0ACC2QAJ9_9NEOP|nr:hypothetical protein PYW08_010140 [Mythimna loreyi]